MRNEELYQCIMQKYNIEKLGTKEYELFEIANKYKLYKKSTKKWYLKPIYEFARFLAVLIVKVETKNAFRK